MIHELTCGSAVPGLPSRDGLADILAKSFQLEEAVRYLQTIPMQCRLTVHHDVVATLHRGANPT